MKPQVISVKDTRDNIADILEDVARTGTKYIITKFNQPKAMIVPITDMAEENYKERKRREEAWKSLAGVWADRDDIGDPVEWERNIRKPRYENIFD